MIDLFLVYIVYPLQENPSSDERKRQLSLITSLSEENDRLKGENRELKEKLSSLDKYTWSKTNGSPVNMNVTSLLEDQNDKNGKYDG